MKIRDKSIVLLTCPCHENIIGFVEPFMRHGVRMKSTWIKADRRKKFTIYTEIKGRPTFIFDCPRENLFVLGQARQENEIENEII